MPDYPKEAALLRTLDWISIKKDRPQGRIIDPVTGFQREVTADLFEYICPLCHFVQPAPPLNNVEYACPKCDARYLVVDELLALWTPDRVGVETTPLKPGELHPNQGNIHQAVIDTGIDAADPEKVKMIYDKSQKKFIAATINQDKDPDKYASKIQVGSGGRSDKPKK